jgi:hypothetical protein
MNRNERYALAVPTKTKPDYSRWLELLAGRIQATVDMNRSEAQAILQCSDEHLPEMWAIASGHMQKEWGSAVARSDSVLALSHLIDWDKRGHVARLPPPTLWDLMEALP